MKTFLKIVAGLALLVVLALAAVFYFTRGMADAANAFFRAVQSKDIAAAQSHLSEGFKADTSQAELERFLADNALDTFADSTWSRREVSGGKGELEGTVTTANGGTIPIKITLVEEGGAWKIHGITKTASGVRTAGDGPDADEESAAPELPSPEAQAALLKQTVADFATSVAAKDMSHFRDSAAAPWQQQFTLEQFESSFGAVYDAGFDFAAAAALEPELQPATALGEHGELVVKGAFPTTPKLTAQAKYVLEGDRWKPYGFEFDAE